MILLGISMDDIMALWENNLRENWENNLRERIISERIGRNWENLGEFGRMILYPGRTGEITSVISL